MYSIENNIYTHSFIYVFTIKIFLSTFQIDKKSILKKIQKIIFSCMESFLSFL